MLRLANSVIGPVWVSPGSLGATQTAEAFNAGDGSLALGVSSTASWAAPSIGSSRPCSALSGFSGSCFPIQIALNPSALAAGVYAADITVSDPNAIDAPQTIKVAIRVADSVSAFVGPGNSRDISTTTGSMVNWSAQTQDGARWLSLVLDGVGSFRFSFPYRIHLAPPAGMAEGVYTGSVAITGAANPADNRTIPVTMEVAAQPIAQVCSNQDQTQLCDEAGEVRLRLAQGASASSSYVFVRNPGQGTLTLSDPVVHASGWLSAAQYPPGLVALTFDPGALSPGVYAGSVDIVSNAVNGAVSLPVEFEVVAKDKPLANFGGVVDAAIGTAPVDPGDIVSIYGEQLAFGTNPNGAPRCPPLSAPPACCLTGPRCRYITPATTRSTSRSPWMRSPEPAWFKCGAMD